MENELFRLKKVSDVGLPISLDLWLEEIGYYNVPASLKYHGNFRGGLFLHSKMVASKLLSITNDLGLEWSRYQSPLIVGLLHDICKCDDYVLDPDTHNYIWNNNARDGHGLKSLMMLIKRIELTKEEQFCIRYHMGAFTKEEEWKDYTRAVKKYPNVLWTHTADMYASQIMEV